MVALKKKLKKSDKQIKKWQKKTASAQMSMKKTNETIQDQITELGKQEFEIISLTRKINDVEFKITDLYAHMSDQEKLLTETKIENSELMQKISKIKEWWGGGDEPWGTHKTAEEFAQANEAPAQSVLEWTVEDVYLWWRVALPRGAQRYIELVKECQLTGVDLLGVDENAFAVRYDEGSHTPGAQADRISEESGFERPELR